MKKFSQIATPFALAGALVFAVPHLTNAQSGQNGIMQNGTKQNVSGANGPIAGAGLPVLAVVVGSGIYWLIKRRRRTE